MLPFVTRRRFEAMQKHLYALVDHWRDTSYEEHLRASIAEAELAKVAVRRDAKGRLVSAKGKADE